MSAALASMLAGVAAICIVGSALSRGTSGVRTRVGTSNGSSVRPAIRRVLRRVGSSRIGRGRSRQRLAALCEAVGTDATAEELVGARVLGTGAATVLLLAPLPVGLLAVPLGLVAWRAPEAILGRRARRRTAAASREVPLLLDLLAVATSAGVAPQLAVRLAAEPLQGPLAEDLRAAMARTDLGRRWRDELAAVAERLGLADLRRTVSVLGRSEALGSSLADEVARLAADVRERRRSRASERARTAPVKMLFPLVFLILPAFLLLTVVPVLLSTVRSIA